MEIVVLSEDEYGSVKAKDELTVEKRIDSYETFLKELYWLKRLRGKENIINLISYSCIDQKLVLPRYDIDLRNGLLTDSNISKISPEYRISIESGDQKRVSKKETHTTSIKVYRVVPEPIEVIKRLALALLTLFDNGIVHGDIRLSNILIKIKSGEIVLADFGMSITEGSDISIPLGVDYYRPPEHRTGSFPRPSWRVDIYSLGVVWLELIAGSSFDSFTMSKQYREKLFGNDIFKSFISIFNKDRFGRVLTHSEPYYSIIRDMTNPESSLRIHPEDLCKALGLIISPQEILSTPITPNISTLNKLSRFRLIDTERGRISNLFGKRVDNILIPAGILFESIRSKHYVSDELYMISLYLANLIAGDGHPIEIKGYGSVRDRLKYIIDNIMSNEN